VESSAGAIVQIGLALSFPLLLTAGALSDLLRYLIPNWIALSLAVLAVPALLLAGAGVQGLAGHLGVGFAVLVATSILFFRGLLGGGDVKLLAAAACWTGWPLIVPLVVYTAVAGGLLAATLIVARRVFRNRTLRSSWASSLLNSTSGVPYGVAIAVGGWLVWSKLLVYSSAF